MIRTVYLFGRWWFPILAVGMWLRSETLPAQQVVPQAGSQTGPVENVMTVACLGLQYLGDATLKTELKLSDDQVKQIDELRGKWVTDFGGGGGKGGGKGGGFGGPAVSWSDFDAELLKILGGDKHRRLGEIALHQSIRLFGDTRAVRYPYLVRELNLSVEQLEALRFDEPVAKILSPDQQKKWQAILGKAFDTPLTASMPATKAKVGKGGLKKAFPLTATTANNLLRPTNNNKKGGPFGGNLLETYARFFLPEVEVKVKHRTAGKAYDLIDNVFVRAELKLAEKQLTTLDKLQNQIAVKALELEGKTFDVEIYHAIVAFRVGLDQNALALLQPHQLKRLRQIQNQINPSTKSLWAAFREPELARELDLKPGQLDKLRTLEAGLLKTTEGLFLSAERSADLAQALKELAKTTEDQFLAALTEGQRASYQERTGPPFADLDKVLAPSKKTPFDQSPKGGKKKKGPTAPLLMVTLMLTYAHDANLHKELKLSPDQIKKLQAWRDWYQDETYLYYGGFPGGGSTVTDRATEKVIQEILAPKQFQRFVEITLQQNMPTPNGKMTTALNTFLRYPVVADTLRLTADQRAQALQDNDLDKILTQEQKANLKKLLGEPYSGKLVATPLLFSLAAKPMSLQYLESYSVRKELQLSDAQAITVKELFHAWQQGGLKPSTAQALLARTGATLAKELQPAQAKRLRQLVLQRFKNSSAGVLLQQPDVVPALKLTEDQQQQLAAVNGEFYAIQDLVISQDWGPSGDGKETPATRINKALTQVWDQRLLAVLTPGQRTMMTDLVGEPFTGRIHAVGIQGDEGRFVPFYLLTFEPPH